MKMDIWNAVQQYMPLLIEMRRYFHCHPELSWKEDHTMAYIEKRLDEFGISYHLIEKGGILGHIDGKAPGKTLLIRADMDALPIDETDHNLSQPRVCRSSVPGVMHACGHDGHMAMQLIVAKLLQNLRHQWDGTVLILFEQGEEDSHAMEYIVPYLERTLTQKSTAPMLLTYAGTYQRGKLPFSTHHLWPEASGSASPYTAKAATVHGLISPITLSTVLHLSTCSSNNSDSAPYRRRNAYPSPSVPSIVASCRMSFPIR